MVGKWHLGYLEGAQPNDRGFEHSFAFIGGGTDHFDQQVVLETDEEFHTFYTKDDKKIDKLPFDFYSSEAYAKQLSKWIREVPKRQPVFAYFALTASHDPLQSPDEWLHKFERKYDSGYQEIY